jgi:hypothetical protein
MSLNLEPATPVLSELLSMAAEAGEEAEGYWPNTRWAVRNLLKSAEGACNSPVAVDKMVKHAQANVRPYNRDAFRFVIQHVLSFEADSVEDFL